MSPSPATPVLPSVGAIFAEKYQIESKVGEGGMGVVLLARDTTLRRRVAIKLLRADVARHEDARVRFLREARVLSGIQSEHVVRVLDVSAPDVAAPFMVMEYLSGVDLHTLVHSKKNLPVTEVADYMVQACEALAEAHTRGIVHRDLKPANLFLTQRIDGSPLVKLLDFGISKVTGLHASMDANITTTTDVMGTPAYMSPEQLESFKTVDRRADIWALGVILHELMSARRPFEGAPVALLIAKILNDPPTPLRAHRPDAPPEIEALVARCLAKKLEDRPRSVLEVARALAPFAPPATCILVDRIAGMAPQVDDFATTEVCIATNPPPQPTDDATTQRAPAAASVPEKRESGNGAPRGLAKNTWAFFAGGGALFGAVALGVASAATDRDPVKAVSSGARAAFGPFVSASFTPTPPAPVASTVSALILRIDAPRSFVVDRPMRLSLTSTKPVFVALFAVDEKGAGAVLLPSKQRPLAAISPTEPLVFPSPAEDRAGFGPVAALAPGDKVTHEKFICIGFEAEVSYSAWVRDALGKGATQLDPARLVRSIELAERAGAVVEERSYEITR